jgi:hypothetical protein
MAGRGSVSFKEPPTSDVSNAAQGVNVPARAATADGGLVRLELQGAVPGVNGSGGSIKVSRSASGKRQQAVLETAARFMAASDSD